MEAIAVLSNLTKIMKAIVKEMNTLIILKQDKSHIKRIAQVEGYLEQELIFSG